ncbi:hypothetical protein MHM582_2353 [Microbacterium sp. HM58-2]|nr:hypothetical protein MHM582_2353 [Microbacterium sp. HM58-2]
MRIRWRGEDPRSEEVLVVDERCEGGIAAHSSVTREGTVYGYRVRLTPRWIFSELAVHDDRGRSLALRRSESGAWTAGGHDRPDLAAAVDIDLSFSPFTNTLPVRRLGLGIGESRDIVTAYVTPALDVLPDPQRYTRTGERHYLYESRDSDFRREILVDADGLVVDYPGLFTRV